MSKPENHGSLSMMSSPNAEKCEDVLSDSDSKVMSITLHLYRDCKPHIEPRNYKS